MKESQIANQLADANVRVLLMLEKVMRVLIRVCHPFCRHRVENDVKYKRCAANSTSTHRNFLARHWDENESVAFNVPKKALTRRQPQFTPTVGLNVRSTQYPTRYPATRRNNRSHGVPPHDSQPQC